MNLQTIVTQLKQDRARLDSAIRALEGSGNHSGRPQVKLSAQARAKIAAAQRARWAKVKGHAAPAKKVVTMPKRKLSAAALKSIRQAQKKRWAAWRKEKSKS